MLCIASIPSDCSSEILTRLDDVKNLGWEIDFSDHHQFAVIDEKDDPPIGKLKRPRLV